MFHPFPASITDCELPQKFTYPFYYTPHPLCVMAAEEVKAYVKTQPQWEEALKQGIMFGVLAVKKPDGELGYLAAFSGNLAGSNRHAHFVPPVYDLLQPEGFFRIEENNISDINLKITDLQSNQQYALSKRKLAEQEIQSRHALTTAKMELKMAKENRETRRQQNPGQAELDSMIRESQYQKAELKRLERCWKERLTGMRKEVDLFEQQIEQLKKERKSRSAALQLKLFDQFKMRNARGETKSLPEIFEHTPQQTPPAGAGECAAPKLLQYAYLNQLRPIAMAEFWWGESPKAEIRIHGHYYPACKGKCEPILRHMLQGLEVEENPLSKDIHCDTALEILWEDDALLVVNKPEGMLSVPGKEQPSSVEQRLKAQYPEATGPLIVHRLDMATSGLMLVAKTKEAHQNLQAQFKNRTVKKRYIALLDGVVEHEEGTINLPLCLNPLDRPRQMVSEEYGKQAITTYNVLTRTANSTRIAFYPLTGRTHQLRLHAAHSQGLNHPITGDELYGQKSDRLYLHAEYIEFTHPLSGQRIAVEKKAPF